MKKLLSFLLLFVLSFSMLLTGCKAPETPKTLATPTNVSATDEGLITWDEVENASAYVIKINGKEYPTTGTQYQVQSVINDFTYSVQAQGSNYLPSAWTEEYTFKGKGNPAPTPPTPTGISVAISGKSEVKSGDKITLEAMVKGTVDWSVEWSITAGGEYATINQNGELQAAEVDGDKIIKVQVVSLVDKTAKAEKTLTVRAKPTLTQEMLDAIKDDKIGFEGYLSIALYTIGQFETLETTYTTGIKTSMDGTNWYAEYDNTSVGIMSALYYKNYNNKACQVGVSLMNDEEYFPMTDDYGNEVSWEDAGLYNSFKNLTVQDFTFNEEEWRYEYTGKDPVFMQRAIASANPYDFSPAKVALIIGEGEVLGIYAKSNDDYNILSGYKGIQELFVAINQGEIVEVPSIAKYSHEEIHDDLAVALENMHALENYTLNYKEITASYLTTGYVQSGFTETITPTDCYFRPFDVNYDVYGNEIRKYVEGGEYGYQKKSDTLYNAYTTDVDGKLRASRAFEADFSNAKPTFAFAPEIFRSYYVDEEAGTTTYYVDGLMSYVASTFYYGVGNDINLYGIFATEGVISATESFTPYVVVKDGYIVEACFYFYLGSIYGVVELSYSDFNTATLPEGVSVEFETRQVPVSWEELIIYVSTETGSTTSDDIEVNALEYLQDFYGDENIAEKMPFFGVPLGDTYGFGLTTIHIPTGSSSAKNSIVFYYDVPLDLDYTINSSLMAIEEYLVGLGFTKDVHGIFTKGSIAVQPVDSSLDLMIYIWKV
ncbi:MAG: hypothetical protein J6D30_04585 [Clostridia bacterium]|nr:hypothetical protein [Clostridia bacterium]